MAAQRTVTHSLFGRGQLVRVQQGGQLWEVQFESGRRYLLASSEFEPLPIALPDDHIAARRATETLRLGIVPTHHIEDLTIGLSSERERLQTALERTSSQGGAALAILADYGCGKTHFAQLAAQTALRKGFLVASLSLDAREITAAQALRVYQAAVSNLRYPDSSLMGIQPLLRRARQHPSETLSVLDASPKGAACPFAYAVRAYLNCEDPVGRLGIAQWLSRQFVPKEANVFLRKAPRLYATGAIARQYTYLLSGISALAAAVGYQGLALLIDEVDYYSRQTETQKQRADMLFKALLCASQGEATLNARAAEIADHKRVSYPLRFSATAPLFFLFATTESEQQMPVEAWLHPPQILRLDERFSQAEVTHFVSTLGVYHAQAYRYANPNSSSAPRLAAVLAAALRERRINPRQLSQIATTFYDLLYLHSNVSPEQLIRELAINLRVENR